MPVLELLVDDG